MAARTITIEIGNEIIRLCEVRSANGKDVMVYHAVTEDTPMGACEDGYIRNVADIATVVKGMIAEENIATKDVTFVINSTKIASKEVVLPNVKKEKMQELIESNASDYFPVNIDEYVLSFTVLETKKEDGANNARVLVYAAPEAIVKSYYELARALKVNITAIDYVGNSILHIMKKQISEEPTLVVQMGMDSTLVSVMQDNILQLQRTIPYGKLLAINSIMDEKKVKFDVALELLHNSDIIKESLNEDSITDSLSYLINNVKRVIEYYGSRHVEAPIVKSLIIGEGAEILNIEKLFANETGVPTELIEEVQHIQAFNRVKMAPSLLRNYLPGIGAGIAPINFVPRDFIELEKQTTDAAIYRVVFIVAVFAAIMLTVLPYFNYLSLSSQKTKTTQNIQKSQGIQQIVNDYYNAQDIMKDVGVFYASTINNNEWTVNFYETLEKITPKDIQYTSITTASGAASITGTALTKGSVAILVQKLNEQISGGNISYVHLTNITEAEKDDGSVEVTFAISCAFNMNVAEIIQEFMPKEEETSTNAN